ACLHSYALYPPRQLALTVAFAAFFAIDKGSILSLAIGGFLAMLAGVCDPYAMISVPAAFALGVAAILRERDELGPRVLALVWFFVGVVVGAAALLWLFTRPAGAQGVASMSTGVIGHNAKLLWHECLPWAIGTKVYKPLHV